MAKAKNIPQKVEKPKVRVHWHMMSGGSYAVSVNQSFGTKEEAMAFAKTLGLEVVETADRFD
jgi:hypothetical protein